MPDRNWQADWELCERATPGPWVAKDYSGIVVGPTCEVRYVPPNPDAEFIAAARKIVPYYLQRVKELEAQVTTMRNALQAARKPLASLETVSERWFAERDAAVNLIDEVLAGIEKIRG